LIFCSITGYPIGGGPGIGNSTIITNLEEKHFKINLILLQAIHLVLVADMVRSLAVSSLVAAQVFSDLASASLNMEEAMGMAVDSVDYLVSSYIKSF